MIDVTKYLPMAEQVQAILNQVLDTRAGTASQFVQGWVLRGTPQNDVILYAVLAAQQLPNPASFEQATHQISSALHGLPVYWSNSTGFRYAVLLSPRRKLPKQIDLPQESKFGRLMIGLRWDGRIASMKWDEHLLAAGITGAGKSVFLRSTAYQALQQGHKLMLADLDGRTFPMLSEHPSLERPVAATGEQMLEMVQAALDELEHRKALYDQVANFPENIDEYNQAADEPLARVLVVLDEFSSSVMNMGGPDGKLGKASAELVMRGRKFGFTVVVAAQDFSKAVIGPMRDQMGAVVAFRVRSRETANALGVSAATQISERAKGRAITDRWGQVQCYYLDKERLIEQPVMNGLTDEVAALAEKALAETGGRVSREILTGWGLGQREARRLLEDWTGSGWVKKDAMQGNASYITPKLADLLTSRPARPARPAAGEALTSPDQPLTNLTSPFYAAGAMD